MNIDATRFATAARDLLARGEAGYRDPGAVLSQPDADAIVALARLAAVADGNDDVDEATAADTLAGYVHALSGSTPAPRATTRDDEDHGEALRRLAAGLRGKPAGELALVVAKLVAIADLDIGRDESTFLDELRLAVAVSEDRAEAIETIVSELLAPA